MASYQSGNIFALLFGAVGLIGLLAVASMQLISGPLRTTTLITQKNLVQSQLHTNARLVVIHAGTLANNGDADADSFIEPVEYVPNGTSDCSVTLVGGGCLPHSLGASVMDPYGRAYGYCVWDHGTVDNGHADGAPAAPYRLNGSIDPTKPVIALISGGRDQTFQTSCLAYDGAGTDGVNRVVGSDDLVFTYTYAEAAAASGGLWTIKPTDSDTAEIAKDLEVKDSSNNVTVAIDRATGIGDFLGITTDLITAKTGGSIELDGNVGIGAPADGTRKLRVGGDVMISKDTNSTKLIMDANAGLIVDFSERTDAWARGLITKDMDTVDAGLGFLGTSSGATAFHVGWTSNFWNSAGAKLTVLEDGRVGIGTVTPAARLDVGGGVRVGNDTDSCTTSKEGTMRYSGGSPDWEYCDGTSWKPFQAEATGGGGENLTVVEESGNFTITASQPNHLFLVTGSATATLPALSSVGDGFRVYVKRKAFGAVNVKAATGNTIEGTVQRPIDFQGGVMELVSTPTQWELMRASGPGGDESACIAGSMDFTSPGESSMTVTQNMVDHCIFSISLKGGGGGIRAYNSVFNPTYGGVGGSGGGVAFNFIPSSTGTLGIFVGGGASGSNGGMGGGASGCVYSTRYYGGGGGGASAVRFGTTLLAIAGGGGGGGTGGDGGAGGSGGAPGGPGVGSLAAPGGGNNTGADAPTDTYYGAGDGGSNGGSGQNAPGLRSNGVGGVGVPLFKIAGGGGGGGYCAASSSNNGGGGGGGYGGGAGGGGVSQSASGSGGGGYLNSGLSEITNAMSIIGVATEQDGSVTVSWTGR